MTYFKFSVSSFVFSCVEVFRTFSIKFESCRLSSILFRFQVADRNPLDLDHMSGNILEALHDLKSSDEFSDEHPMQIDFVNGELVLKPVRGRSILPSTSEINKLLAHARS